MPDPPPSHLAEPASPPLLGSDVTQAAAEAHTYVRHIERISALAARAAERPYILPRSLCYARTHRARGALLAERARTPPRPQAAAQLQNAGVAAVHPGLGSAAGGNSAEVCWRYLFGADCFAEERTGAFACALCLLQCCSFEGLMEHLEASHRRLHCAGAAGFLGTDYLVEARTASDFVDDSAYDAHADLASVTAEFERRFPTWQDMYFICPPAQRRQRMHLLGLAQGRPTDGIFAALPGRRAPRRIVTCRGLHNIWAARKRKLPPAPTVATLEGGRVLGWQRLYHARTAVQMTEREVASAMADPCAAPDSEDEDDVAGWKERSKHRLLAAGAELVDSELELAWNWNIHVRKHPVRANMEIPAACDSFARTYAALLSSRAQFHAAFVAHLLTLADAGLLPAERMDACLALISAPRGAT